MGVDMIMSGASLGKIPTAPCRPFRPGATEPVLFTGRNQTETQITIRRVFPIETLPVPVTAPDGSPVSEQLVSEERFAVDVTLNYWRTLEEERIFNAWVSRQEYEALKSEARQKTQSRDPDNDDNYLPSLNLSPKEWIHICGSCPLHIVSAIDCSPRLFGYGTLPLLRRAVGELGSGPHKEQYDYLTAALGLLFPTQAKGKGSRAAKQDASFQAFFNSFAGQGLETTPKYVPESPPPSDADQIVDLLFFWEFKPVGWVEGPRIKGLALWLDQFMGQVEQTLAITGTSEEMKAFLEVMLDYHQAIRQADQYNLQVRMSW